MKAENALIIFIKNPELGKVKTRIARTTGDEKALDIYFQLSKITRENALLLRGVTCYLFYSDFVDSMDNWSNIIFQKKLQIQGDLGEKMQAAFAEILNLNQLQAFSGTVGPEELAKAGLVGDGVKVKILGRGDAPKGLTVRAHRFSDSAKAALESAGGKVEVI